MLDFTFLEEQQCCWESSSVNQLEIFKKRGAQARVTDYAALCGAKRNSEGYGEYYTKTEVDSECCPGHVIAVSDSGYSCFRDPDNLAMGFRPAVAYSSIKDMIVNKRTAEDGILEVSCFLYPEMAPTKSIQQTLDHLLKENALDVYGKEITRFRFYYVAPKCDGLYSRIRSSLEVQQINHKIYEYNNRLYTRIEARPYSDQIICSNGETYKEGDLVWIEISPINMLVEEKSDLAVFENIVFAGHFFCYGSYQMKDWDKVEIKNYMNNYFSKDLIPINYLNFPSKAEIDYLKHQLYEFVNTDDYMWYVDNKEKIMRNIGSNLDEFLRLQKIEAIYNFLRNRIDISEKELSYKKVRK